MIAMKNSGLPVRLGVSPLSWTNDVLEDLGRDIPLETCLREASEIGYEGLELGRKFPRNSKELLPKLGERKHQSLESVTEADIVKLRNELLAEGRRASTVNGLVRKILAQPFRAAKNKGLIQIDPIAGLKAVRGDSVEKHIFTAEQVQRLINAATGDWKGMVIAGFYTGARLGDLANLTWGNVDLFERTITFTQKKTGAKIKIPIAEDLHCYLLTLPMKDNPKAPVFPTLLGKSSAGKSGLSMAFGRLMERAGIEQGTIRERGDGVGRKVSARSFHSLRHSFNTSW
jgi:integrase